MIPMRVSLEFYIPDPLNEDVEELEAQVKEAIEEIVGEVDYTVSDYGLNFELQD